MERVGAGMEIQASNGTIKMQMKGHKNAGGADGGREERTTLGLQVGLDGSDVQQQRVGEQVGGEGAGGRGAGAVRGRRGTDSEQSKRVDRGNKREAGRLLCEAAPLFLAIRLRADDCGGELA